MKKNKSLYFNIIYIFLLEIILSIALFKSLNITFLLFSLLSSIVLGSIIDFISHLTKYKIVNKLINIGINLFFIIFFIAQLIHYKFYQAIMSIYSMFNGGQVFAWFSEILKIILKNWYFDLLFILVFIVFVILSRGISYERKKIKNFLVNLIFILSSIAITFTFLNIIDKKDSNSPYNLYYNVHAPTLSTKKLGLINTMALDIKRLIFGFEDKVINNNEEIELEEEVIYNITDIDFDSLIKNENDEDIISLHEYFKNNEPTKQNQYTGYFKDKNLIYIMAESFNYKVIDENLTPTLFKFYNEGITFDNFYNPIYSTSTSDGEYMSLNSLLPKEGKWSFTDSKDNYLPYSLGNMFKNNDYKTYAFHNGTYDYYERYLTHKNIGFDTFIACGNGLEKKINCNIWPQSDVEMIEATFDYYKNEERFITYYMTISGHLNYTYVGNTMANKNRDYVDDLDYSSRVKGYIATHIELDNALKILLEKLEENNMLDDTVIVIGADHYPYGLNSDELIELGNEITDEKFDIHKNTFIIWNKTIKEKINVTKYTNQLDILPTLYNLFGFTFDSRLLMGKDMFSDEPGIVIFNDRSFITEYGKYNSLTDEFITFKEEYEDDYVSNINNEIYNKFAISRLVLQTDYYRYLKEKDS